MLQLLECWGSCAQSPSFLSTCHAIPPARMLFPVPSSGLTELPPQEENGPDHPAGIRPQIHHPPRPAQLLLPYQPHARFGDLPGAPLWTASAQHPRHQELGAWGAHQVNAGMNEHTLLCHFPATRFPPDAAGRSLFGVTEEERGTAWGPWGWEEWTG